MSLLNRHQCDLRHVLITKVRTASKAKAEYAKMQCRVEWIQKKKTGHVALIRAGIKCLIVNSALWCWDWRITSGLPSGSISAHAAFARSFEYGVTFRRAVHRRARAEKPNRNLQMSQSQYFQLV